MILKVILKFKKELCMKSYLSIGALILASLLSNIACAAPQPEKITRYVLTVAGANDEWTSTTVKVAPGDILLVRATGSVTVGAFLGKTSPDGADNGIGQLQMKIGATSVQHIGSIRYIVVTEAGMAKLRVYDTNYQDNSGEYTIELIHIPASLIPEARKVAAE